MIYEDYSIAGEKIADGALLAAEFTTQGNTFRAIRFDNGDDDISYFAPNGESMLGTFLRSPVEFSRISSRFGHRKHPILKTWRAHNGVDYAAARGTPIRSTAEGKVIHAGKKGGYGNTVIVSHAGRFSTLYAHMTGFAKSIKRGARVQQGQVVGYIGSTGLATGPHLHYEFRLDGVHRNPLTFKTPKATAVSNERRSEFDELATTFGQQLNQLRLSFTQDYDAVALDYKNELSSELDSESNPELVLGNGVGAE
jgi:murein DD-endopeptidase MepM/ murein hydrolase activator NlpD